MKLISFLSAFLVLSFASNAWSDICGWHLFKSAGKCTIMVYGRYDEPRNKTDNDGLAERTVLRRCNRPGGTFRLYLVETVPKTPRILHFRTAAQAGHAAWQEKSCEFNPAEKKAQRKI